MNLSLVAGTTILPGRYLAKRSVVLRIFLNCIYFLTTNARLARALRCDVYLHTLLNHVGNVTRGLALRLCTSF